MSKGWIGVDLDGTLAEYTEWKGPEHIGAPIPSMVTRVKRWLAAGYDVRIFTARVAHDETFASKLNALNAADFIRVWCSEHLDRVLPITNVKDYGMIELWDDRCVQVEQNTGRLLGQNLRVL